MNHIFMQTRVSYAFFFGIIAILFFTQSAEAYVTTDQDAVALDNHAALFLIDYEFGHGSREMHLPIFASSTAESAKLVSYEIVDDEGVAVGGKSAGIVFSTAPYRPEAGMYVIPKNEKETFTLAVVFTPDSFSADTRYRLKVTNLPFSFNGEQQLELNPSELTYYTTEGISL